MKRMDIFCASQASTAICLSMEQASCSSSNAIQLGGRVIDRHNPLINDSRRSTSKNITAPCSSSQPPIDPKKKSSFTSSKSNGTRVYEQKKKKSTEDNVVAEHVNKSSKPVDSILKKRLVKLPADSNSITPHGSTRSLLSDRANLDGSSDYGHALALSKVVDKNDKDEPNPASKPDQVVVLRVSLHCKGCEGKLRKHISKMQGKEFDTHYI
ncbi:hypothetical protein KIW84_061841 [Lathyrus oleraceus]|uniref:Uncharacterized protein n=1 Tax=Pisum sativum TaxID=3888 RepID=A0A9D4W3J9_PEA|nr:hypothetical protein KIW84_061841 [Pisum sativum]